MYPQRLALALDAVGIDTVTVASLDLRGASDAEVFEAARGHRRAVVTENVADFVQLAAACVSSGNHHPGALIALSTRFSRRRDGTNALVDAIGAIAHEPIEDRVLFLEK